MTKKRFFILLLIIAVGAAMAMTACGKSGGNGSSEAEEEVMTLEKFVAEDPEIQQSIDSAMNDSNVKVEIKENDIIYSFDLSTMEGYTEDIAKSDELKDSLSNSLDGAKETFGGIAKSIQEATQIEGIRTVVNYSWGDEVLVSRSFTAEDAPVTTASETEDAEASEQAETTE